MSPCDDFPPEIGPKAHRSAGIHRIFLSLTTTMTTRTFVRWIHMCNRKPVKHLSLSIAPLRVRAPRMKTAIEDPNLGSTSIAGFQAMILCCPLDSTRILAT